MRNTPKLLDLASDFQLRPYQLQAVNEVNGEYLIGKEAVLLVAPTGSGKTAVGCHFVKQAVDKGQRCLWLAHRSELIKQASQRLAQDYRVRHGIIKAGVTEYDPCLPVLIASVQTLARRKPIDGVGLLVVDEAHHATAETYLRIIEGHPDAIVLGLTATPWRLTGKHLGSLFDGIVAVADYPFLIEKGFLVRPRVFLPAELPDFSAVRIRGGDFDEEQAAEIMERPKLVGDVVKHWNNHANSGGKPRTTVVFACNVEHSRHIVSAFRDAGVAAEHLDSQVPEKEREAILERLARGQTTVVSNVILLSEGFDCPPISCVIVARPTASRTIFIQMVGRALRPCPEAGKTDCIILDHAGNSFRHGLVSEITSYELDQGDFLDPTSSRQSSCKLCPSCKAAIASTTQVCPECRYSFSLGRKLPEVREGELEEHAPSMLATRTQGDSTYLSSNRAEPAPHAPPEELGGSCGNAYQQILLNLRQGDIQPRLAAMNRELARLSPAQKLAYVKFGLLSESPHIWLEHMVRSKSLAALGFGCLEKLAAVRLEEYKGLTHFERTKRALQHSKPDLVQRFASLLFAVGVPDHVQAAKALGFRTVRGYATRSAEIAASAFQTVGVSGELRECTLELIRQHGYLFEQILNETNSVPIRTLCQRWRQKLGPLWKQHFELAEVLWDGPVLRWICANHGAISKEIDAAEEKVCSINPEECCPIDGNALIDRYGLPAGPWIRVMKQEIGQWCLSNPTKSQDLEAVHGVADAIFERNRRASPGFNVDLPYLQLDDRALSPISDPLGIQPLLVEASRLKVGEVAAWAKGYRKKAVVALVRAISFVTNGKPLASLCVQYANEVAFLLKDITLGELLNALASHRRPAGEVTEIVKRGRAAVAHLKVRFERSKSRDHGVEYARVLRNLGHFEEAYDIAIETLKLFGPDPSTEKLVASIKKHLPPPDESPSETTGQRDLTGVFGLQQITQSLREARQRIFDAKPPERQNRPKPDPVDWQACFVCLEAEAGGLHLEVRPLTGLPSFIKKLAVAAGPHRWQVLASTVRSRRWRVPVHPANDPYQWVAPGHEDLLAEDLASLTQAGLPAVTATVFRIDAAGVGCLMAERVLNPGQGYRLLVPPALANVELKAGQVNSLQDRWRLWELEIPPDPEAELRALAEKLGVKLGESAPRVHWVVTPPVVYQTTPRGESYPCFDADTVPTLRITAEVATVDGELTVFLLAGDELRFFPLPAGMEWLLELGPLPPGCYVVDGLHRSGRISPQRLTFAVEERSPALIRAHLEIRLGSSRQTFDAEGRLTLNGDLSALEPEELEVLGPPLWPVEVFWDDGRRWRLEPMSLGPDGRLNIAELLARTAERRQRSMAGDLHLDFGELGLAVVRHERQADPNDLHMRLAHMVEERASALAGLSGQFPLVRSLWLDPLLALLGYEMQEASEADLAGAPGHSTALLLYAIQREAGRLVRRLRWSLVLVAEPTLLTDMKLRAFAERLCEQYGLSEALLTDGLYWTRHRSGSRLRARTWNLRALLTQGAESEFEAYLFDFGV